MSYSTSTLLNEDLHKRLNVYKLHMYRSTGIDLTNSDVIRAALNFYLNPLGVSYDKDNSVRTLRKSNVVGSRERKS